MKILLRKGLFYISMVLILFLLFFQVGPSLAGTSNEIKLEDFSGTTRIYHEGNGDSNQTVITDADWAWDQITVSGESGSSTVLDQFINSDDSQTQIRRNALFIGEGDISSQSSYKGSKSTNGEDGSTGVVIVADGYGVLIQSGGSGLIFNEDFGGMTKSVVAGGSNPEVNNATYYLEQYGTINGYSKWSSPSSYEWIDILTKVNVAGSGTATLESSMFGSFPQAGADRFNSSPTVWALGDGTFVFSGSSGKTTPISESEASTTITLPFGYGQASAQMILDALEANLYFEAN